QAGAGVELYLRGFQFSAAAPATTRMQYLWQGRECFVESDGLPTITPAEAAHRWYGQRYAITWEARASYAGQPFLSGALDVRPPTLDWSASGPGAGYPIATA